VIARQGSLALPLRWFAIPQCWRYERMTRGRRREHYQWNMDIWGVSGVEAEAELIAAIFDTFARLGLRTGDALMRLNSRAFLEEVLRGGLLAERPGVFEPLCVVIDKLDKIGSDAVIEQLCDQDGPVGLERGAAGEVVDLLGVRDLEEAARRAPPNSKAIADLRRLLELLAHYGCVESVRFDASVVRGLAYYTGVVFEAFDARGELRALCGGGRYDHLLETLGGRPLPAAGFGFGDAVIGELLSELGLLPELPRELGDVVVGLPAEPPLRGRIERAAVEHARGLRREGRAVELALGERLKRALRHADRSGAERLHMIGPEEVERGVVRVRDLRSGSEREEPLSVN
jgi:histidyl-tRNA synthetase